MEADCVRMFEAIILRLSSLHTVVILWVVPESPITVFNNGISIKKKKLFFVIVNFLEL